MSVAVPLTKTFAEQIAKPVPPAHIETSGTPRPVPAADPTALGTIGSAPDRNTIGAAITNSQNMSGHVYAYATWFALRNCNYGPNSA